MNCLSKEQITYKAQGHELWRSGEEHLLECKECQQKVEAEAQAFVLSEAKQSPNRPNKMGRSHPRYIKAVGQ